MEKVDMSETHNANVAAQGPTTEPDDAPEHSVKKTKALAKDIRDAIEEVDAADDVWTEIEVNEPNNPESTMIFRLEDRDLYYDVHIIPVSPEVEADGDGE